MHIKFSLDSYIYIRYILYDNNKFVKYLLRVVYIIYIEGLYYIRVQYTYIYKNSPNTFNDIGIIQQVIREREKQFSMFYC